MIVIFLLSPSPTVCVHVCMHMCVDVYVNTALYTYILLNFFMVSYCSGHARRKHENPISLDEGDM